MLKKSSGKRIVRHLCPTHVFLVLWVAFSHLSSFSSAAFLPSSPRNSFSSNFLSLHSKMDDEFGDASFLGDFDVEQMISNSHQKPSKHEESSPGNKREPTNVIPFETMDNVSENTPQNNNKRLKVESSSFDDAPSKSTANQNSSSSFNSSGLQATLQQYFGYSEFRPGQEQVIEAIVSHKQDVAIFWATGAGKSLCYQIPPLHLQQVAIVVSPLISLMQDQVAQLNARSEQSLAVFLGSAQTDASLERKALQGHFPLIYVTPEKMGSSFPSQLVSSGLANRICLIAVDEAHCVSEWGHDFRPDYRTLGETLRTKNPALRSIPILSLTATATSRVKTDIVTSLQLRAPLITQRSVDRSNLRIYIQSKTKDVAGIFREWCQKWNKATDTVPSTIIYVATRNQVDQIAALLQQNLSASVRVAAYHAGLSAQQRQTAHMQFLTGQVPIIVATVAFGMGIDKPDIREIIHYGPPKTVEEYAQQIGRAGRDGLSAQCTLIYSPADFDKYLGDFYLGQLTETAKQVTRENIQAFKAMCQDHRSCRRKVLVEYFQQTPEFGDWCGTCDVCLSRDQYEGDQERDFGVPARILLTAVQALKRQGLGNIMAVANGQAVEKYRYAIQFPGTPAAVQNQIKELKGDESKYTVKYLKELLPGLVQSGYIAESTESKQLSGFAKRWTVYDITPRGRQVLQNRNTPILLPVPQSVRDQEKQEDERRQRVLKELSNRGLKKETLPESEVNAGDGTVIRAYSKWYSFIEGARRHSEQRATDLEDLLKLIDNWRAETAIKLRIAPASVLAEHLMVSLAYSVASLPQHVTLNRDMVLAAGVRTITVDDLVASCLRWREKSQLAQPSEGTVGNTKSMVLRTIQCKRWEFAVYKPQKKTGKATWENYFDRFYAGENPLAIAMAPGDGKKPIQVQTVVAHILEGCSFGREVDLERLAEFMPPPNEKQWEELRAAELATGMDVCADPETSGRNGDKFTMTEFLKPIVGEKTENMDRAVFGQWCNYLKWYLTLRRAGYEPKFVDSI